MYVSRCVIHHLVTVSYIGHSCFVFDAMTSSIVHGDRPLLGISIDIPADSRLTVT